MPSGTRVRGESISRPSRVGIVVAAVVLCAACGRRVNPAAAGLDCNKGTGFCFPHDGGMDSADAVVGGEVGDASEAGDGSDGNPSGTVSIVSPTSPTYTNGKVTVTVSVSAAVEVDVLLDGAVLKTLMSTSSFDWDSTGDPEGSHTLAARATIAGQVVVSAPVTVVVDRTPPTVKAGSPVPAASATEVALADPITVEFSEAILPSTVTNALAVSQASGPIATTATLDATGTKLSASIKDTSTVLLDPATPAALSAAIVSTVTDLAGNALVSPPQWSWTAPLWLDYGSVTGESARLALDGSGTPYVSATFEPEAMGSHIYDVQISKHIQGKTWDTTIPSPQTSGSTTSSATTSIVVDSKGQPLVAWSEAPTASDSASVHVARWSGTAWDSRGSVDQVPGMGTPAVNPSLALDAQDDLFLAWAEIDTSDVSGVYVSRWTGTTWSLIAPVGAIGANVPVLLVEPDGAPIVEWNGGVGSNGVSKWTGTAWHTQTYASSYSSNLALTKALRPVVAYPSDTQIRLAFGDVLSEDFAAPISAGTQPASPAIAMDSTDHLFVVWVSYDGTARTAQVARWTGIQWDRSYGSLGVTTTPSSDVSAPSIALDSRGVPIVIWQETDLMETTYVRKNNR